MATTTLELPSFSPYAFEHRATVNDLNYAMHFGADKVLPVALEAQMHFYA